MAVIPKIRAAFRRTTTDDASPSVAMNTVEEDKITQEDKKDLATDGTTESNSNGEPKVELPSEDLQRGVQKVEAVALAWTKKSLIAVFLKYVFALAAASDPLVSS